MDKKINDILSANLKKALEINGMEQQELAEKVGITDVTVSRYINKHRTPNSEILKKIADVLGVSTDWLLKERV